MCALEALEKGLGFYFPMQDMLVVVPVPTFRLNPANLLHSDNFPAIQWKDGKGYYYLNGVKFPQDLWKEVISGHMPFDQILKIVDIDQRTQAMRYGNVDEFLKHVSAKVLDTYQKFRPDGEIINYALYEIPVGNNSPFTETAYYMFYDCPSTGKKYISGVAKPMRTDELNVPSMMAWKFSDEETIMSSEEWKSLSPLITES